MSKPTSASIRSNAWLLLLAVILSANVIAATGLVDGWGRWYSFSTGFRRQTDALLHDAIALDAEPSGLDWDLAWANGGVQQPWGLGVPAWRLPFECAARLCGFDAFPDRLALAAAVALVAFVVLKGFTPHEAIERPLEFIRDQPAAVLAVPLLVLFPPLLTMCRGPFLVYDETELYSFLAAVVMFAGLVAFRRRPTFGRYLLLTAFAGLASFVRPTLVFYGIATLLVAAWQTRQLRWPFKQSATGVVAFGLGLALLFATNVHRFGSGFEFGHSLNLNRIDATRFASRFDAPYRHESLPAASRELFSILFRLGDTFNTHDRFGPGQFAGQSPTIRWRELYFETYDLSFLAIIVFAWCAVAWRWRLGRTDHSADSITDRSEPAVATWSLMSATMCFLFYLRCPFISSRYAIDFAPAFAVAIWLAFAAMARWLPSGWSRPALLFLLFSAWWGYETFAKHTDPQSTRFPPRTYAEMRANLDRPLPPTERLPDEYQLGADLARFGIPFNGAGWDTASGQTKAAVALFVHNPQRLQLEVAPAGAAPLTDADYACIQAKVGLEFLAIESSTETAAGRMLIFARPRQKNYQAGVQVAFLGMIAPQELSEGDSKFRLLRVRWRDD